MTMLRYCDSRIF